MSNSQPCYLHKILTFIKKENINMQVTGDIDELKLRIVTTRICDLTSE